MIQLYQIPYLLKEGLGYNIFSIIIYLKNNIFMRLAQVYSVDHNECQQGQSAGYWSNVKRDDCMNFQPHHRMPEMFLWYHIPF